MIGLTSKDDALKWPYLSIIVGLSSELVRTPNIDNYLVALVEDNYQFIYLCLQSHNYCQVYQQHRRLDAVSWVDFGA